MKLYVAAVGILVFVYALMLAWVALTAAVFGP